MPKKTPHIIELLHRWLRGDARARDERRLERRAADDDFLRDALEGYRRFPDSDHEAAVGHLEERLRRRSGRTGGGAMLRWLPRAAAAAVALLLITGAAWLFLRNGPQTDRTLAREETPEAEAPKITDSLLADHTAIRKSEPPASVPSAGKEARSRPRSEAEPPSEPAAGPTSPTTPQASADTPAEKEVAATAAEESAADVKGMPPDTFAPSPSDYSLAGAAKNMPAETSGIAKAPQQAPVSALRLPRGAGARSVTADTSTRLIQGRILTPAGEPLIGATVLLPGTDEGTVTDLQGEFSLQAPAQQQSFTVSYAGYQSVRVPITRQDSFRVTLEENAPLSEIVVTDLSPAKRDEGETARFKERSPAVSDSRMASPTAVPQGGYAKLESYIRKNLQYPKEARRQGIEGIVLLQFSVQADGKLDDFKVLQPLGHGCDREAIRLLEKGPKWEVRNGQAPLTTTYPVVFKID